MASHHTVNGCGELSAGDLEVLGLIAGGAPLADVLDRLVRVIEADADGMVGSVLLLDDGRRLRHGAAPHLPAAWMALVDGAEIGPSVGSCGTAAHRGETVVVHDIATDPLWADHRVALDFGLRACWSVPILGPGRRVLGTFAMYYPEPRTPTNEELALAEHGSQLAAIAIERWRTEEALVRSERRARSIIEHALDAHVLLDGHGRVTGWSGPATELFGWTAEEATGRRLWHLIVPERDRPGYDRAHAGFEATGETAMMGRRLEILAVDRDGREFPVELAFNALDIDGEATYSGFITDVSARRRAEQALHESEQHLVRVYEHVGDILFHVAVEPGGRYRFAHGNPPLFERLGRPPSEVLGRLVDEVLDEPLRGVVLGHYAEAVRTGQVVRWQHEAVGPRGKTYGDVAVTPVFGDDGRPMYLVVSMHDVTESKLLEEELRQLQKLEAIGTLAGSIAHDFNNILSVVMLCGTSLLDKVTDDDQRQLVTELVEAGERGAQLTKQVLAFSRKQVLRPAVVDLNAVVSGLELMLHRLIGGKDVAIRTELADGLWPVEADRAQIEQVIVNLATNARDAMPHGGTLTVSTANVAPGPDGEPARVALTVADTGTGMDEATQRRIFEPFFSTKGPERGTGLGLPTVYGIVAQSGGTIGVTSEPGAGTRFQVLLPRSGSADARDLQPPELRGSPRPARVLVVDEKPGMAPTFTALAERLGCEVTIVGGPLEALSAVHAGPLAPDLLITDIHLQGMSGQALAGRLLDGHPTMKVLYTSGDTDGGAPLGDAERSTGILRAPFTLDELAAAVGRAVGGG